MKDPTVICYCVIFRQTVTTCTQCVTIWNRQQKHKAKDKRGREAHQGGVHRHRLASDRRRWMRDRKTYYCTYNLSSDLKRGKRAGWQVNLSNQLFKLISMSSGTCHCKWDLSRTQKICLRQPANNNLRIASASEKVLACSSLSKSSVFGWTRYGIWPWYNPPPTSFTFYKQSRSDTGSTKKMGINNERESERFSHQRRRMSQWSCWLWVVYMFPESKIFLLDESLRSFNLDEKNNALLQNYFAEFKVSQLEVSYPRPTIIMFCWNVGHSTWVRLYFHRDTHHWPQKKYAYNNFRHTKLLSEPPTRKRRPWKEATLTRVCPCLTFRCVCTRNQGWVVVENPPTPQQHCRVAVWPLVVENINSTNIIFTGKKLGKKNRFWPFFWSKQTKLICFLYPFKKRGGESVFRTLDFVFEGSGQTLIFVWVYVGRR